MSKSLMYYIYGSLLLGVVILFYYIYEIISKKPDPKFGYAIKSPFGWTLLIAFACPFINILTLIAVCYFNVNYYVFHNRRVNIENQHSDNVVVPIHWPSRTWHSIKRLNRCTGCFKLLSETFTKEHMLHVFSDIEIQMDYILKCPCCGMIVDGNSPENLIDNWNKENPVSKSIEWYEGSLTFFKKVGFSIKMILKKSDSELKEVEIFVRDVFNKKE